MEQQQVEQQDSVELDMKAKLEEMRQQEKKVDQKEEEKKEEEKEKETLASHLKQFPGSPTQEVIDKWKAEHAEVLVSGFSSEELFVWRTVTREEWSKLQEIANESNPPMTQLQFEELLCNLCILWKSTDLGTKGGTATTLHEQILQNSNFFSPQAASMLVMKL